MYGYTSREQKSQAVGHATSYVDYNFLDNCKLVFIIRRLKFLHNPLSSHLNSFFQKIAIAHCKKDCKNRYIQRERLRVLVSS